MEANAVNSTNPLKALPLFDLFLDLPHPGCAAGHQPPVLVKGNGPEEDLAQQIGQIANFAFPEYDHSQQQQQQQQQQQPPSNYKGEFPLINKYSKYAMQAPGFQHFTFTLQLQSGSRVHGHVRRYLPHGPAGRYDVGRRPERALVLLTRISGADLVFTAVLKSVEALAAQETALAKELLPRRNADEPNHHWFLRALANYHQHLAQAYMGKSISERGKPMVAALEGMEVGNEALYNKIDVTRFVVPTAMLQPPTCTFAPVTFTTSMLPLLRCVGVAHTLRLVSALLSERRIVLVSASPTRLTSCSHAALAMLAQGMLHWQHLYVPVLPQHMWQYLAAPYPYLIGILTDSLPKLDRTDGLGEVLVLHLDQNTMETRNIDQRLVAERLPDLFVPQQREFIQERVLSLPEHLAGDLQDVLKLDKKVVYAGVDALSLQNVSESAVKATKYAKKTIVMLAGKTNKFLNKGVSLALKRDSDRMGMPIEEVTEEETMDGSLAETDRIPEKTMDATYIYSESCHIEVCEEEARVAFAMFFVCLFGNMRWYLSTPPGQQVPQFDGNRFLQEKQRMGEGEGTPMWPLLRNFTQSQMFHEFAKARVDEVRAGRPVAPDMPLFIQCTAYHRQHNQDFGIPTVRRNCGQIAQASPQRVTGQLQSTARRNAMSLTSNKNFEGDYSGTIAQLVEQCRECTLVLFDVMSVCWLRLQDCKGLNWKHAYHALHILRNLLLHGPVAAVTEATDGLDKIRAFKYYENMRLTNAVQVRGAAATVYNLLVDRSKLFSTRRFCMERRRELANPKPKAIRDRRFDPTVPFRNLHAAASPIGQTGTRVNMPTTAPAPVRIDRGEQPTGDLLGSFTAGSNAASSYNVTDQSNVSGRQIDTDLLGSFTDMNISATAVAQIPAASNPFDAFTTTGQSGACAPEKQIMMHQPGFPTAFTPTDCQHSSNIHHQPAFGQQQAGAAPTFHQRPIALSQAASQSQQSAFDQCPSTNAVSRNALQQHHVTQPNQQSLPQQVAPQTNRYQTYAPDKHAAPVSAQQFAQPPTSSMHAPTQPLVNQFGNNPSSNTGHQQMQLQQVANHQQGGGPPLHGQNSGMLHHRNQIEAQSHQLLQSHLTQHPSHSLQQAQFEQAATAKPNYTGAGSLPSTAHPFPQQQGGFSNVQQQQQRQQRQQQQQISPNHGEMPPQMHSERPQPTKLPTRQVNQFDPFA